MTNFNEILKMINAGEIAPQLAATASKLAVNIGEVDKFRYKNSFITIGQFLKTYSLRKEHFDSKSISYSGMAETLSYLSQRDPKEVLSLSYFISLKTHYLVLFSDFESDKNVSIIGFFSWG